MFVPPQFRILVSLLAYVGLFIIGYKTGYLVEHLGDKNEAGDRTVFQDKGLKAWFISGLIMFAGGTLLSRFI